jgi:hypothetical protein
VTALELIRENVLGYRADSSCRPPTPFWSTAATSATSATGRTSRGLPKRSMTSTVPRCTSESAPAACWPRPPSTMTGGSWLRPASSTTTSTTKRRPPAPGTDAAWLGDFYVRPHLNSPDFPRIIVEAMSRAAAKGQPVTVCDRRPDRARRCRWTGGGDQRRRMASIQ